MFLIVIDAVMQNETRERRRVTSWGLVDRLQDLDFADDVCLLSEAHSEVQTKIGDLKKEGGMLGLAINTNKTKALRVNTSKTESFMLGVKVLRMWIVLYNWVVRSPKMEGPRETWHNELKKQTVLLYKSTQCGETRKYLLELNPTSFVVM
jgi:hypothetical protein